MKQEEIVALCQKHGGELHGEGNGRMSLPLAALEQLFQSVLTVPAGTIVVQAEQIHFGGGISAYPNKVERAARRLAEQMFVGQDEKVSRTASELNSQRDS